MGMQRYFIHYFDGDLLHEDLEGFCFPDEASARHAAIVAGRAMIENDRAFIRLQRERGGDIMVVRRDGFSPDQVGAEP